MAAETSKPGDPSPAFSRAQAPDGPFTMLPATSADSDELAAMAILCERDPWSADTIASAFVDERSCNFLCRRVSDGVLCSYVLARQVVDELEIHKVATHPDFRRQGRARRLLIAAMDQARMRGGKSVFLEVRAGNTAAQALYRSIGFHVDSVRKEYYDSKENAVLMSRIL